MTFKKIGLIPWVFIIATTAILLALSAWQFKRLAWKEAQISQIESAMGQPVVASVSGDVAYRKALLTGRYLTDKGLQFVGQKSGGFLHFVPFQLDDSDEVVLINTGWFEKDKMPEFKKGITTVEGLLRPMRERRRFSPENAVDKNIWFTEDLAELNAHTRLKLAPYVLEAGKLPPLRNDHLGYAITWLLLAISGVVMFVVYFREKPYTDQP